MSEELTQIPGLQVLAKLSSGGMGEILLARRRGAHGFEKLVAVKVIKGELAQRADIRAMFHDEARLVALLDHPTIAQVYDFGEAGPTLYLAMEYVPGIPLNQLLAKRGRPLPPLVAARIASEVARGLHAAHELTDIEGRFLGVVHRDVSPGNLILTYDGRMKILDFGIAFMSHRESPDTQVGELKGKPSYMAPEQLRAERVDRRSDIYSLCVVLHELLTGRKLFTKANVVATAMAVERGEVPPPSTLVELPEGLEAVVMKGLEKRPEDRLDDARQLADRLDSIVSRSRMPSSIDAFVDEELAENRRTHRAWLQSVLSAPSASSAETERTPTPLKANQAYVQDVATALGSKRRQRSAVACEAPPPTDGVPFVAQTAWPAEELSFKPHRGLPLWLGAVLACAVLLGVLLGGGALVPRRPVISHLPTATSSTVALEATAPPPLTETGGLPLSEEVTPEAEPTDETLPVDNSVAPVQKARPVQRRRRRPPARPDPEPVRAFGYLTVGAQPYALVRLNGKDLGVTPIVRRRTPAGIHLLQLVRPDTGEVRLERRVTIRADGHARITHR